MGEPLVPSGPKVIHDAIWGTQRLYENEVAILDTLLLQRLRQIHQTGFTYLTYPSVTHTRFDHTLGVLYQADRLARALLDKYQELNESTLITRDKIRHLRIAALLHDCSHGPFSRTSEEYYSTFPEIQEYRRPYKRALVFSMNSFRRPEHEEEPDEVREKADLNLVYKLIDLPFEDHRELAETIWRTAGKPGRKEEVWLDFPRRVKSNDLAETFVNVGSLKKPMFLTLGDFIPIEQWSKQYLQQKWRGHVFCRPEYVPQVSQAAADVLSKEYKIEFTDFAWMLANLDPPPSHAPSAAVSARSSVRARKKSQGRPRK